MKTKTFRFHFWDISSKDWNKPPPHPSKSVDRTWTMASDTDLELYAKYEANHIGAYKYEELYNNEEK